MQSPVRKSSNLDLFGCHWIHKLAKWPFHLANIKKSFFILSTLLDIIVKKKKKMDQNSLVLTEEKMLNFFTVFVSCKNAKE